jgi:hypothetical protein
MIKNKRGFARNSAFGKRFGENDLPESIGQSAVGVKARKVHTVGRNFGQLTAAHLTKP